MLTEQLGCLISPILILAKKILLFLFLSDEESHRGHRILGPQSKALPGSHAPPGSHSLSPRIRKREKTHPPRAMYKEAADILLLLLFKDSLI